ncbi:MAG: GatB/YqeY domain-containing protein [Chromatiales bacterium]|nr:GatB/YqeY domain-containing protein [Chromatiales bacterium]
MLAERIRSDLTAALKAGNKGLVSALRLITAEIKQREVDTRTKLDDAAVLAVLDKMAKQRRESIEQFAKAGRDDLVATEQAELDAIAGYMPKALGEDEITRMIDAALVATGAAAIADMGKVMAELKPQMAGRADMSAVSRMVKARLTAS